MGEERDPRQLCNFNLASNAGAPILAKQSTSSSILFPNRAEPHGFFRLNLALPPPSHPTGFASGGKRFMVLDHSKNQTNLIYNSVGYPASSALDLTARDDTKASNGNAAGDDVEMQEDTEEIDALLYSDSCNDHEEGEAASTGHSPIETAARNLADEGEVSSSAEQPPPAKRRRVGSELDPSLADTASSTGCKEEGGKQSKREKIREKVGILRRMIPGSGGRDAAAMLGEAIQYLRSLGLKAKGPGATSSNLR